MPIASDVEGGLEAPNPEPLRAETERRNDCGVEIGEGRDAINQRELHVRDGMVPVSKMLGNGTETFHVAVGRKDIAMVLADSGGDIGSFAHALYQASPAPHHVDHIARGAAE